METSTRATVGLILLVGGFLAVAVLGIAPGAAAQESNATDGNVTFGAQVSAFMQSTAADTNGTVDRGMWRQSVENTSSPEAAVSERVSRLERRVDELEARSADLAAEANESDVASVVYTARASEVRAELANLRESVDETAETANSHGVDDERLADLQERAGSVSGPEVAETARTLTDSGPDREPGPPTDSPGADTGNGSDDGGTGEGGPPDDRGNGGPPDDRGGGPPDDGGDGGPPDDGGNGGPPDDAGGGDGGPGDAGGNGNDNAGGNGDSGNDDAGNGGSNGGGSNNGGSNSGGSDGGGGPGNSGGNAGGTGPGGNGGPS